MYKALPAVIARLPTPANATTRASLGVITQRMTVMLALYGVASPAIDVFFYYPAVPRVTNIAPLGITPGGQLTISGSNLGVDQVGGDSHLRV